MKYIIGGIIIEMDYQSELLLPFQYSGNFKSDIICINTNNIKYNPQSKFISDIDSIFITKNNNIYQFSFDTNKVQLELVFMHNESSILYINKKLSSCAVLEMIEKKVIPIFFYNKRTILPLHSTMVSSKNKNIALMGASFAGKSTLAAHFVYDKGYKIVTDDILPIYNCKGKLISYPMASQLRLRKDSQEFYNKRNVEIIKSNSPQFIDTLFLLCPNDKNYICSVENKIAAILKNLFATHFCDYSPTFLSYVIDVSKKVDIYELHYKKGFDNIQDTAEKIELFINRNI